MSKPAKHAPIERLTCTRCAWSWYPTKPQPPKKCPGCGTPYWNRGRARQDWPKSKRARRRTRADIVFQADRMIAGVLTGDDASERRLAALDERAERRSKRDF